MQVISALLSIVGSALVTKVYAEKTSDQTLRDHGVQIARGVMVLNSQIDSLSVWVGQKRENMEGTPEDGAFEHVELTLLNFKDMTSAALSGIAGIIGDALQQYQSVMDRISGARQSAYKETTEIQEKIESATSRIEVANLEAQLQQIRNQTEQTIAELTRQSTLPIPTPDLPIKRAFLNTCPSCNAEGTCEILDIPGQTKVETCKKCGRTFNNHVTADHKVKTRLKGVLSLSTQEKVRLVTEDVKSDQQSKVLYFLRTTSSWVPPKELKELAHRAARISEERRALGQPLSPHDLQSLLISEVQADTSLGLGSKSVRVLMKLLYLGRAFRPPPGEKMMFRTEFVNWLKEDQLLKAYLGAVVFRLKGAIPFALNDRALLSDLLLGSPLADKGQLLSEALGGKPGTGQYGALSS